MQASKNKRLLLLLVVLSITTLSVFFFKGNDGQLSLDKKMFQVEDQEKIDRVVFESPKGKVEVSYDGTTWQVNNAFQADRKLVKVLFATLLQVVPKRPVAESVKDSINNSLQKTGTKVSLFEKGELRKVFYVGSNVDRTQTYFQQKTETPFLVVIPGYRVDVSGVFELDENGWRDKRVFSFNWRNLKNIKVSYPKDGNSNFTINLQQKLLSVEGINITDTTRLSRFVDDLYTLAGDQIVQKGQSSAMDSLFLQNRAFEITITDIASRSLKLDVIQWKSGQNQISGVLNDSLRLLFEKTKIFRIAKTKDYFKKRE